MPVYEYKASSNKLNLVAGGTLYADAPIGVIQAYGGTTAPSGWLLCKGQAVSRTEYADLFKAIGTAFGEGDSSTTFNVPDLREAVPVGTGTRENDTSRHDIYNIGTFKDDRYASHSHTINHGHSATSTMTYKSPGSSGGSVNVSYSKLNDTSGPNPASTTSIGSTYSLTTTVNNYTGSSGNSGDGTVTHGKQLGVNYIIKAKQSAVPADFMDAVNDAVETELKIKNITLIRVNVDSSSGAWANRSGKVVNVNLAALVTLDQTTPSGTILLSGLPKPVLDIVRFGVIDAQTIDVVTGLVQINSAGNLVADGQGLKPGTAYWGSFTYLTNE